MQGKRAMARVMLIYSGGVPLCALCGSPVGAQLCLFDGKHSFEKKIVGINQCNQFSVVFFFANFVHLIFLVTPCLDWLGQLVHPVSVIFIVLYLMHPLTFFSYFIFLYLILFVLFFLNE